MQLNHPLLAIQFDPLNPAIAGATVSERRLSDLRGYFADAAAYTAALTEADPVLYRVYNLEEATGDGALHYGFGVLMPGKVGDEYFMTKGHYHAWRPAAEVYIGLSGSGYMLLEDETTGHTQLAPLTANSAVYVPGATAHRTINTGSEPLTYIGILSAKAGHDYGSIAERNFRCVVAERNGVPTLIDRLAYLEALKATRS